MKKITVDKKLVNHVAYLSRLKINQEELLAYEEHMQRVLGYVEQLAEIDTQNVEPLYSPIFENQDYFKHHTQQSFKMRSDEISDSLLVKDVLKNTAEHEAQQFKINAVIEGEQ